MLFPRVLSPMATLVASVAALLLCVACGTAPAAIPPATNPAAGQQSVTLNISARGLRFDTKVITVPAGSRVTINFDNQDVSMPHNIAIYQILPGGQTRPVFVGDTITGPAKITYRFTAPTAAGSYFFECDVHPDVMNGIFTITG